MSFPVVLYYLIFKGKVGNFSADLQVRWVFLWFGIGSLVFTMMVLDEDIRPPSITTDGARSILQRLSEAAEIDIYHPKHDYLAPHGGRRGMGEVLVRAFGYTVVARYLDNSEEMAGSGIRILKLVNWVMSRQRLLKT